MLLATQATAGLAVKAKFFRGFGDPSRLSIIEVLRDGPRTVGEIVEATGLSQSNVSNHLGCLRDCGLVVAERNGRFMTYHLGDDRVGDILALAESLLAAEKGIVTFEPDLTSLDDIKAQRWQPSLDSPPKPWSVISMRCFI